MSLLSDRWIKSASSLGPLFNYHYLPTDEAGEPLPPQLIHESWTLADFRFEDVKQALRLLNVGERYTPDTDTVIVRMPDADLITPFIDTSMNTLDFKGTEIKVPSYGLSSYGYDIRLGRNFKVMNGYRKPGSDNVIDFSKNNVDEFFTTLSDVDALELQPHSFALGVSMERIVMPRNITAVCMGKSTIARNGLHAFVTPLECGWSGYITIELKNETDYPMRLYSGMGIMQLQFLEGNEPPMVSYADRSGKYQNQEAAPVIGKV